MDVFRGLFGEKWPQDIGSALYHDEKNFYIFIAKRDVFFNPTPVQAEAMPFTLTNLTLT